MSKNLGNAIIIEKKLLFRTAIYSFLIILISLFCFFINIPIISNYLHDVESKTYDLLFLARNYLNINPALPKNIVIVGIDASSIKKVGVPWPWPRQFHASLVDALSQARAKAIVFDIIFDTISPLSLQTQEISGKEAIAMSSFDAGKEDDDIFAMSISGAMNVFLACEVEPLSNKNYYTVLPINTYLKALNHDISFLGNTSVQYDRDNFVRRAKLIYPEFLKDPAVASSTGLRVVQKYLNKKAKVVSNENIKLSNKILPSEFLINFYGVSETFKTIPYWQALDLLYAGNHSEFKDKIVLIGRTKLKASIDPFKSVRSPDSFATPFSAVTPNFSGVEIQATIIANLLDNSFITEINKALLILLINLIGLVCSITTYFFRSRLIHCLAANLFLSLVYIVFSFISTFFFKIAIPPTYPIYGVILPIYLVNFLDQYFIVDAARRRQAKIFRQLVAPQVADDIEKLQPTELALGGTRREITVLFSDVQNFTSLCEKNSPETIVAILNEFFTEMVKVIHKHNGLVDKFIGDAIMTIWGAPNTLNKEVQANLAVSCAISMKEELKKLNKKWSETGFQERLSIRIGINTDEAVIGNLGSLQRMQFSAVGDGVNVASRLEAVNKIYGTEILMSSNTANLINEKYEIREIDTVIVPGKDTPISIFELVDGEKNTDLIKNYAEALMSYRNKRFDNAIKSWEECLKTNPFDKPSKVMYERTIKLIKTNLTNNWKPIWVIENRS